jgi:hypothetical protein
MMWLAGGRQLLALQGQSLQQLLMQMIVMQHCLSDAQPTVVQVHPLRMCYSHDNLCMAPGVACSVCLPAPHECGAPAVHR